MNFKELRKGMIVLSNTIKGMTPSRELSTARTSIQKSMMWTGTYMKFAKLGDNPYAKHDGNRMTVKDIEPLFDATSDTLDKEILAKGEIHTIDKMRTYLGEQLEAVTQYMTGSYSEQESLELSPEEMVNTNLTLLNLYTNLTESRMWLGMELGRIRDEA